MVNPRQVAVLVRTNGIFRDRTEDIEDIRPVGHRIRIVYARGGAKPYDYAQQSVAILNDPQVLPIDPQTRVLICGELWETVHQVLRFTGPQGTWTHVFHGTADAFTACPSAHVELVRDHRHDPGPERVLRYWTSIAQHLAEPSSTLRDIHRAGLFVHPESVLHRYLHAGRIDAVNGSGRPPLYPFRTNLSQRAAVANALGYPISVIDGPPGTGKTQTILNLIANIVVDESKTVAVVSSNNTAVDNVDTKLREAGFGYIVANLGRAAKREQFLNQQVARNTQVDVMRAMAPIPVPQAIAMVELDRRLLGLREIERDLAQLRAEHAAYLVEQRHFDGYLARHELPDTENLPVLRWQSEKIIAFIADTDPELARTSGLGQVIDRIGKYFKYRSMRFADDQDVDVVLRLHQLYYRTKLAELGHQIAASEKLLTGKHFDALAEEQREQSQAWLTESLRVRYLGKATQRYDKNYLRRWPAFSRDYPVVLSTCHSLQRSIGKGRLVDYLVIDEASQVDLLAAAVAMSCCRNLIVVGDLRQLQPVDSKIPPHLCEPVPHPAYDFHRHSILSSLTELFGDSLPRVMLREHYRCDPAIIGFCNQKFYGDDLIPFSTSRPDFQAMVVARTSAGNHMRRFRSGGRINQREIDVIEQEVLQRYCAGFEPAEIGITSPYRKQADRVGATIADSEADTVHSFQGREKDVIVMTTVLDEKRSSQEGPGGLEFVDDPQLVNVAVSRAKKRFVLVTNNEMLPRSSNLSDLIGYIRYQHPDKEVFDSDIVSVFDLLYRQHSERLDHLAARVARSPGHKSERVMRAVLGQLLPTEFPGLTFAEQVPLKHLLPDTERLSGEERRFARNRRSSVDFEVYNRVTKQRLCVIEVDGFEFHENRPDQLVRDARKDAICVAYGIPLLRFATTGSEEIERLRRELTSLVATPPPPHQT